MEAKKVRSAIERLPDEVLYDILSRVSNKGGKDYAGYCLVCKRWNRVGKEVGLDVSIDYPLEWPAFQGGGLELGRIRRLSIDMYLGSDYSWLVGLSDRLEEITIDGGVLEPDKPFDLGCLFKCSKLKYMSLARVEVREMARHGCGNTERMLVSFPALTCCMLKKVVGVELQQLLDSCPRLERLEAEMFGFNGLLRSARLRELRLEAEAGGDFKLDFPDLEAAFVGDCMKLELKAPRLKRLSLGSCQELVSLDLGSPLQSLDLYSSGFRTAAAVDRRHFACVRLKSHGCLTGGYCAHKVAKLILVLPQLRECKELTISGCCDCHPWKCSETDQLFSSHEVELPCYKLTKIYIEDNKGSGLEEMLASLVKQCPALRALEVAGVPDEQFLNKLRASSCSILQERLDRGVQGVQSRRCTQHVDGSKLRIRLLRDSIQAVSCN
ncbi:hypothetical protein SELMODRAFT_417839 [Selaginella moellendorffii]|uniref:F-box domain-containing protein n=1 Tax=Selaginella moellendorffii TaxID=88036 RepID=D8S3T6_SELML|nr:hypothetical protein SELMODRAFT_417839 [Selaginella moellendorffii]